MEYIEESSLSGGAKENSLGPFCENTLLFEYYFG